MIIGKVSTGFGKGKQYVEKYQQYFIEHLEFIPYFGTLNLVVSNYPDLPEEKKVSIIPSGQGRVDCYPVLINNKYKGAIVVPHKTRHGNDVIELICPEHLREVFKLNDGDEIKCELV